MGDAELAHRFAAQGGILLAPRCWKHRFLPASDALARRQTIRDTRRPSAAIRDCFARGLSSRESRAIVANRSGPARRELWIFLSAMPSHLAPFRAAASPKEK